MTKHFGSFGLALVLVMSGACGLSPVAPVPASATGGAPPALTISAVSPAAGWPLYYTEIFGAGFDRGVRVTFDGIDVPVYQPVDVGRIRFAAPWHVPGAVDVVVTNSNGESVTLPRGFTYRSASLQVHQVAVSPGDTVVVSWSGPPGSDDDTGRTPPDVVALFASDDPDGLLLWSASAIDRTSDQLTAPARPGTYELRYYMFGKYVLVKTPLIVR